MIPEHNPFKYERVNELQRVLVEAFEDDHAYNLQGGDKLRLPWMPFQMADFIALMSEIVRETDGGVFLEIGSGVGTKMMVAKHLFGLYPVGIEYDRTLATIANQKFRGPVVVEDALTTRYSFGNADIIWMYRVFRDEVLQAQLERRIYNEAKPGAIFAGAALQTMPPANWITIVDDTDINIRGAWKKAA